jgi:hypothetical protein
MTEKIKKNLIKKNLKNRALKLKKRLIRNQVIDSPLYEIFSRDPNIEPVRLHKPLNGSPIEYMLLREEVKNMCQEVDAEEIIVTGLVYRAFGDIVFTEREGIFVNHEDHDGITNIAIPFRRKHNGKVIFYKDMWNSINEENPSPEFMGFIQ